MTEQIITGGLGAAIVGALALVIVAVINRIGHTAPVAPAASSTIEGIVEEYVKDLRDEVRSLTERADEQDRQISDQGGEISDLQAALLRAQSTIDALISWARALLAWGHSAGAVNPPDPPAGLVLPEETTTA